VGHSFGAGAAKTSHGGLKQTAARASLALPLPVSPGAASLSWQASGDVVAVVMDDRGAAIAVPRAMVVMERTLMD
jgi:hypothetical protein